MDAAWRLLWALPLVLTVGGVVVLALRRCIAPATAERAQRLRLRESLPVSAETCAHLIEVDGRVHLLVESTRHTVLETLPSSSGAVRGSPLMLAAFRPRGHLPEAHR